MPILTRWTLAVAASACTLSTPAIAYWDYGHQSVARIAWLQMKPETRRAVSALLRDGALLDTPTCPVTTIEQASVWADCVKPLNERFAYAYAWHFQDVDICKPFDLEAPCSGDNCVSAQIARQARLLADPEVPKRERIMALAFLVHFVGDLHQPLHTGEHHDGGGNAVAANYGVVGGRTNLHKIWDGYLAERAISTPPSGPDRILAAVPPADRARIASGTIEDWSRELWGKARDLAYRTLVGDPCVESPAQRPTLAESEVRALIPAVRENVVAGGIRLAWLLDDALGPEHKAPARRRD